MSFTQNVNKNIDVPISLTPGKWIVCFNIEFESGGSKVIRDLDLKTPEDTTQPAHIRYYTNSMIPAAITQIYDFAVPITYIRVVLTPSFTSTAHIYIYMYEQYKLANKNFPGWDFLRNTFQNNAVAE